MKAEIIRKLRLKKGCKYIIFFTKSAGISQRDLAGIDYKYVDLSFLVETTRGIKVIEKEN